jgi:hypothetical protein
LSLSQAAVQSVHTNDVLAGYVFAPRLFDLLADMLPELVRRPESVARTATDVRQDHKDILDLELPLQTISEDLARGTLVSKALPKIC